MQDTDPSEDQTCLDEFQECIEEYQECFEVVQICIDEEHSFNHSPDESSHDNIINSNYKLQVTDLPENDNYTNKSLQNNLSESELDLSFKSVSDTLTNNLINKVSVREQRQVSGVTNLEAVREYVPVDNRSFLQNDSSTQSDRISTQSSKLTDDKDGYETCIDESLSEDVCSKVKSVHPNVSSDLAAQAQCVDVRNKTDTTEVQNSYAEDLTPTNSPVFPAVPEIAGTSGITLSASEPCLTFEGSLFSKSNHICLDNKLDESDDLLKSYDNQDDSVGTDEFFLVQYPGNYFSNMGDAKSHSAPSFGISDPSNQEFSSFVQYKQYLSEYYTNYRTYWESCREYSEMKKLSRRGMEEISDDEIFDDILIPFKSQSAPSVLHSAFVSAILYDGIEKNRRKSAFEAGFHQPDTDK